MKASLNYRIKKVVSMIIHEFQKDPIIGTYIEYTHSANSLFHFMSKMEYLQRAIEECVIYPRYFKEWIEPLGVSDSSGTYYSDMGVLGICFCDIPLNRICVKERIEYLDDNIPTDVRAEGSSHPELYGEYAIAFSKEWSSRQRIQPVRYYIQKEGIAKSYRDLIKAVLSDAAENTPPSFESFIMDELSLLKPVQGEMQRTTEIVNKGRVKYRIRKNFFDEQEWRFVPSVEQCEAWSKKHRGDLSSIIANPNIIDYCGVDGRYFLDIQSDIIEETGDRDIGLCYQYSDIKYLIVPNEEQREQLVTFIQNKYLKARKKEIKIALATLISKVLVLNDLRRDFS